MTQRPLGQPSVLPTTCPGDETRLEQTLHLSQDLGITLGPLGRQRGRRVLRERGAASATIVSALRLSRAGAPNAVKNPSSVRPQGDGLELLT